MKPINLSLFADAHASQPSHQVQVAMTTGGESEAEIATLAGDVITVGVIPVWGIALGWVLLIVAASQATKRVLTAGGVRERMTHRSWQRWMYVVPIAWGVALAGFFGPDFAVLFGVKMDVLPSLIFLGPGSGATAAFAYDFTRGVILPVLPAAALAVLERFTGITLPDSVKNNAQLDFEESEASHPEHV